MFTQRGANRRTTASNNNVANDPHNVCLHTQLQLPDLGKLSGI